VGRRQKLIEFFEKGKTFDLAPSVSYMRRPDLFEENWT
jgi:hypothetical protein